MDEVQYGYWKAGILSESRRQALMHWTLLGLLLYGFSGGLKGFFSLQALVFFLLGYLAGSPLLGRLDFAVLMAFARRRGQYLAGLAVTPDYEKVRKRDRLIMRVIQLTLNLSAAGLAFTALEAFF